ncbi:neuroplastin-like [Gigantopelta aegis]|uniref:neuroplastin-like n=1 Tax=Gigantopelta aegis TaxID=1735272 RepID=UPI001B88DF06|nr:neuroplastin-like [Gigantopelta aegis]
MGTHILNICLLISLACGVYGQPSLTIRPPYQTLYLIAPAKLNLSCEYHYTTRDNKSVVWKKDNVVLSEDLDFKVFTTAKTSDDNPSQSVEVTFCQKEVTSFADGGQYFCSRHGVATKSIFVEIINVTTHKYIYIKRDPTGSLQCTPSVKEGRKLEDIKFSLDWQRYHKNGIKPVGQIDGLKDRVVIRKHNYTLEIQKPIRTDSGEYTCAFTFGTTPDAQQTRSVTVPFYAAPFVNRFDKSKNLIEEDPLTLHCTVVGHPTPTIQWQKDGVPISSLNQTNIVIQDNKETGLKNGTLYINKVRFEDKGVYACFAFTQMFNASANSTIHVRVKDKLAAVWPFLAIVAEVVILCIIIFIYEKRHTKAQQDDDAACQATSTNASDTKGKEVRQRNVRA